MNKLYLKFNSQIHILTLTKSVKGIVKIMTTGVSERYAVCTMHCEERVDSKVSKENCSGSIRKFYYVF